MGSGSPCGTGAIRRGDVTAEAIGVSLSIQLNSTHARLELKGPADVWFAIALGAHAMADQPWALVANASGVIEQQLGTCNEEGRHCGGTQLVSFALEYRCWWLSYVDCNSTLAG